MLTAGCWAAAIAVRAGAGEPWPWVGAMREAGPETRARAVLAEMRLDEKLAMLHGADKEFDDGSLHGSRYVGNVMGNTRLGIPMLNLNDGPQGFRGRAPGISTAWPAALSVAASFSRDTMFQWGWSMGEEFHAHGANVQLGPGVCLARVPTNGRNFECTLAQPPVRQPGWLRMSYSWAAAVIRPVWRGPFSRLHAERAGDLGDSERRRHCQRQALRRQQPCVTQHAR